MAVEESYSYNPYGLTIKTGGTMTNNPYAYTGRELDDTDLYYYRARYYDPTIQRFINEDPISLKGGLNTYSYVGNNPISFIDPLGLYPGEGIVNFFSDAFGADADFWRNYQDMRNANTIGADKYFHCKANCEAAQRGLGGSIESQLLSELRELTDEYLKGDPRQACDADRQANNHGRKGGTNNPDTSCRDTCSPFRPNGLSPQY